MSERIVGEPRWPMTLAVVVVIAITTALPGRMIAAPHWILPGGLLVLLVALIATDPGAITKTSRALRLLSVALVVVMVFLALSSTVLLVRELIDGGPVTNNASTLLAVGGSIWVVNIVSFALLYWEFDCGGPARRAYGMPEHPDFAFPQQLNREVAPPGWRPQFVDYLYIGTTNAVAFSPTDAMPLAHWAKLAMSTQGLISLAILGLVISRAVNVFK